jgi:hypothetical protein
VITPKIPALNAQRWQNDHDQSGDGYYVELATLSCGWRELARMRKVRAGSTTLHESPALIGCALAVHRELYAKLWGFDRHMRLWGVEDLDFGLKCWLMGHPILHDPEAVVGHRFRAAFDNYTAPLENLMANQLRLAYKNFAPGVWADWLDSCRRRHPERLVDHPEGLWAHVWKIFEADRPSADRERSYLQSQRVRDEFWYADRFGLRWPRLETEGTRRPAVKLSEADASPSPPPQSCGLESISPDDVTIATGDPQVFTAQGDNLDNVQWSSGGDPSNGEGEEYETEFEDPGNYTVTAQCNGANGPIEQTAQVTAVQIDRLQYQDPNTGGWIDVPDPMYVVVGTIVTFKALPNPSGAEFPMNKPTWTGTNGDGQVVSAGFYEKSANLGDFKVVTAKCGNTQQVNVIVYQLSGKFTPTDNFGNRSNDRFGLMETVDLSFTTDPVGVTAQNIGSLTWALVPGGVGKVNAALPNGTAQYGAGPSPGTALLQLTINSGPSAGSQTQPYTKTVVPPTGGQWIQASQVWHCHNTYSIGIAGDIFINTPNDVSFANLSFTEGFCAPSAETQWFIDAFGANYSHTAWGIFFPIGPRSTGGKVAIKANWGTVDCAFFWKQDPPVYKNYPAGQQIVWPIPWLYSTDGTNAAGQIMIMNESATVDPLGNAKISKGTGTGTNNQSDASAPLGAPFTLLPNCPFP